MRRPPLLRSALLLAIAGVLAGAPATLARADEEAAPPTIYKWVDTNGIAHYTTDLSRVPRSVRGSVRALGGDAEGYAARDAGGAAAPPAEPPPEWDVGDAPLPAPAPAPAPAPVGRPERESWAGTDRPFDMPPGEATEAPPAEALAAAEAPASEPPASVPDREALRRDLDARIAALQAEIDSDENALKGFLAVPGPEDPAEIAYDQSFREVAERLPRRLAELRSPQGERAQLEQP